MPRKVNLNQKLDMIVTLQSSRNIIAIIRRLVISSYLGFSRCHYFSGFVFYFIYIYIYIHTYVCVYVYVYVCIVV